jgi:CheY-specific phosphatase CheX/anti-anti-sigma regulatory factor
LKATIRKNIAIFYPRYSFLDSTNVNSVLNNEDLKGAVAKENVAMVLVSFKQVRAFNAIGIQILVERLQWIQEELSLQETKRRIIKIGFCDFSDQALEMIHHIFGQKPNFDLFRTFNIATFFVNEAITKNIDPILLWHEDYEQRTYQAFGLYENKYNVLIAHNDKEFSDLFTDPRKHYLEVVRDSYISVEESVKFAHVNGNAIVYSLDGYLDSTFEKKFNLKYHNEAIESGFKLFIFDMKKVLGLNANAVEFIVRLIKQNNINIVFTEIQNKNSCLRMAKELEELQIQTFKDVETFLENKSLVAMLGGEAKIKKKNKKISKDLISQTQIFVNATISTFKIMLKLNGEKNKSPKIQKLDTSMVSGKLLIASIALHGDLDGIIILVFPYKLAKKSCSVMICDEVKTVGEILDSLGEFTNVIAGRSKTKLAENGYSISITLPRTYTSLEDLEKVIKLNRVGVQLNLFFDTEEFIFFLTR